MLEPVWVLSLLPSRTQPGSRQTTPRGSAPRCHICCSLIPPTSFLQERVLTDAKMDKGSVNDVVLVRHKRRLFGGYALLGG